MQQYRINLSDVVLGQPLPWDVYDEDRHLLLNKGHVVETAHQLEILVERGLFIDGHHIDHASRARVNNHPQKIEITSVLRLINSANKRLERLLYGLQNESDAQAKLLEVAKVLVTATSLNADIAIACIVLNQAAAKYAVRHCIDTAILAIMVARAMKKTPEEILIMAAAALTMNIGMLRDQDQLQNRPGGLSDKEFALIRNHPQAGVAILKQAGITDEEWLSHVLMHHENEDGSGYPLGKDAGAIAQNTRILAFSDHYCACVSSREYGKLLLPNVALCEVFLANGKPKDPVLSAYFVHTLGTTPPGTFVRLQNGEIGVVTRKGAAVATPVVHALIGPRGAPLAFPIQRDTSKALYAIREPILGDTATLRFSMHQLWGDEANL